MPLEPHDFVYLGFTNSREYTSKIAKLYKLGLSLRDLEARFGISKTQIRDKLLKEGIPLRDRLKERQRATQGTLSKKAAKPPYGFCYSEGRVVRHPKEYPYLLSIIQRWKRGQALNSIATWLNEKKVISPLGKSWSWNSINNIIQRIKLGQLKEKDGYYELK